MPGAQSLEQQVQTLKDENKQLVEGYERKLKAMQEKLDKLVTISIIDDVKVNLMESYSFHSLDVPKSYTEEYAIDDTMEEWLFSELMSRQKRIPPNKLLTTLDPSISLDKKALNGSFDTIDDDSNLDTVLKDVLGCKEPEARAIKSELGRLDDWSFSQFSFEVISKGNPLLVLGYHLLDSTGVIKALRLEPKKILNFLSDIQGRYHSQNPYHNRMHAADVLQATNYLGGSAGGEALAKHYSPMDRLILYIGSAIHDFDHPGVNNNFMINTASSQAILYNDKSVLENHHVAAAFIVYDSKGKNFLSHVSREEYKTFRSSVIDLVLSTDLSLHFSFVTLFKNKIADSATPFAPFEKNDDKMALFKVILKCADVSHPARHLDNHLKWSSRCFDEFFRQGDEEKRLGLAVSPFMDRDATKLGGAQLGFIEFICIPVFEALDQYIKLGSVIDTLRSNRNFWKQKKEEEDSKGVSYTFPSHANER